MKSTNYLANLLRNIGQSLVVNQYEPCIEQKCDRFGNQYWQVHDYQTNSFYSFGSDQDVRAWLENRYHRI